MCPRAIQTTLTFTFPEQAQPAPVAQLPEPTRPRDRDEEPVATQPQVVTPLRVEPEPSSAAPVWISWTTTALLGAGTAVTGAFVLSTKASLTNKLSQFPGDSDAIESDRRRGKDVRHRERYPLGGDRRLARGLGLRYDRPRRQRERSRGGLREAGLWPW